MSSLRILRSFKAVFFVCLCYSGHLSASLIKERQLDFVVDEQKLVGDNIQMSSTAMPTEALRTSSASLSEIDFARVAEERDAMLFVVKFAFHVSKGLDFYSKENIFDKNEFEKISQNTTVLRESKISANKVLFNIKKKISVFSIKADMDVEHYDKDEIEGSPYKKIKDRTSAETPVSYVFTFQKTYHYSKYFRKASNACLYSESAERGGTIIQCVTLAAMERKAYKRLGIFTNLLSAMEQEILFSTGKIMQQ